MINFDAADLVGFVVDDGGGSGGDGADDDDAVVVAPVDAARLGPKEIDC